MFQPSVPRPGNEGCEPDLQRVLERVLALPACDPETGAILRAFLAGDRSPALAEQAQNRFRSETTLASRPAELDPTALACSWAMVALSYACLDGLDAESAEIVTTAIRYAEEALAKVEA